MTIMQGMRRAACVATVVLIAACSVTTNGNGSDAPTPGVSTPDFPSGTPSQSLPASSSPASSGPVTPSAPTTKAGVSEAERAAHLDAQTNGEPHTIVGIPGGYEAATYDQGGTIDFWHNATSSATWRQVGRSRYPYAEQLGAPHATTRGALLRHMQHATFIVHGLFTGDASGNAVAFATGRQGWGAIKAERNGNIGPSGHAVGADQIGLSYDFSFSDGYLQTKDCPTNRPIAECGAHPVRKRWLWTGHDYAQVHP